MSEIDAASGATRTSQRSSPSVAELFSAAGIVTSRHAGPPVTRPRRVVPFAVVLVVALGVATVITLA